MGNLYNCNCFRDNDKENEKTFNNKNNLKHNSLPKSPYTLIQSYFRGFITRKKLNELGVLSDDPVLLRSREDEFAGPIIRAAERGFQTPLDPEQDWKKYYKEREYNSIVGKNKLNEDNIDRLTTKGYITSYHGVPCFYKGDLANNTYQFDGKGILYVSDGRKYEGTFKNGELIKWGRFIDQDGSCFEGFFVNGILNGRGYEIYRSADGTKQILYEGEFVDFKKEGKGKETTDETIFEGLFKGDLKNGQGHLRYRNNKDEYKGEFTNGEITGIGQYKWSNNHEYIGSFLNAKMHGLGHYIWDDGSRYDGEYKDNVKEGRGTFKWADGRSFEGEFSEGRPNGKGIMTVNGEKFNAIFQNGVLVKGDMKLMEMVESGG